MSYFEQLKQYCADKPEAVEDHPWGETVFKVKGKVFTFLGMPDSESTRITVKARAEDRDGLLALPFISVAPYVGRYGWVKVEIADEAALEMAIDLIDLSYEQIAAKGRRSKA